MFSNRTLKLEIPQKWIFLNNWHDNFNYLHIIHFLSIRNVRNKIIFNHSRIRQWRSFKVNILFRVWLNCVVLKIIQSHSHFTFQYVHQRIALYVIYSKKSQVRDPNSCTCVPYYRKKTHTMSDVVKRCVSIVRRGYSEDIDGW